ncbi:hypothetical protein FHG87_007539 [Trinorchestia longiramus]|nr:hypothetical protein FHG87_007539 [Trinorchestia longiramus]
MSYHACEILIFLESTNVLSSSRCHCKLRLVLVSFLCAAEHWLTILCSFIHEWIGIRDRFLIAGAANTTCRSCCGTAVTCSAGVQQEALFYSARLDALFFI